MHESDLAGWALLLTSVVCHTDLDAVRSEKAKADVGIGPAAA